MDSGQCTQDFIQRGLSDVGLGDAVFHQRDHSRLFQTELAQLVRCLAFQHRVPDMHVENNLLPFPNSFLGYFLFNSS